MFDRVTPCSSVGKESVCSAGDPGLIPGSGRSPAEGNGHSSIFLFREAWCDTVHGVARVGHDLVTKPPLPAQPRLLCSSPGLRSPSWHFYHWFWCQWTGAGLGSPLRCLLGRAQDHHQRLLCSGLTRPKAASSLEAC